MTSVTSPKKTGIALFGAGGRMGQALVEQIAKTEKVELLARVERENGRSGGFTPLKDLSKQKPEVVIDFSSPEGTLEICRWCVENHVALVIGTTGFQKDQLEQLKSAGTKTKIFMSPNMSFGLNGLSAALKTYLKVFSEGEVVLEETHHKNKKDAPSGTAKLLRKIIEDGANKNVKIADTISIRGGDVFGVHRVSFFSDGEWVTFEHHATGRLVFARGAVSVAQWLVKQKPGFYDMNDFLKDMTRE